MWAGMRGRHPAGWRLSRLELMRDHTVRTLDVSDMNLSGNRQPHSAATHRALAATLLVVPVSPYEDLSRPGTARRPLTVRLKPRSDKKG